MESEDLAQTMTTFARTFPCLRGAPGVSPWEPIELDRWAVGPASHGERVSASFVLAVWDSSTAWESRFDLMDALNVWDIPHREAFVKWASNPWWP